MPVVLNPDPFNAVMLASPPSVVSVEQKALVREVLEVACSDSRFAEKAYAAITRILAGQTSAPPSVGSLTPNSAEVGDPNFILHVHGTGYVSGSIIVFNGGEEPTTYVSATEVTTGVDMSTVSGPSTVTVAVLNPNGVQSDPMTFTFTDGTPAATIRRDADPIKPTQLPAGPKDPIKPVGPK